jgi:hypothetical protein
MDLHHLPRHPRRFSKTPFPEKLTVPLLHHSLAGDMAQAVLYVHTMLIRICTRGLPLRQLHVLSSQSHVFRNSVL